MITNSVMLAIISLTLLATCLLGVIRVASGYQSLQHEAESKAIGLAQIAFSRSDISSRNICENLDLSENQHLDRCEVGPDWVEIELSSPINALGATLRLSAKSRVGFGFYSQNRS